MSIHLIEHVSKFTRMADDVWENGWWKLNKDQAQELVGSEIYFHKKRTERSFYGGIIEGYRVEPDGKHEGLIVFKFKYSKSCRNVRTTQSGWSRDMKVITAME